jgi:hypothetical protein
MPQYDYPDADTATVRPYTEAGLAEQLAATGTVIRFAHGRYWRRMKRGFYAPLHWLARMTPLEARRPGLCWGYVAGLEDRYRDAANASIPINLAADIATYSTADLPKSTRRGLRLLDELGIRIVKLTDAEVLHEQGYDLVSDWRLRKGLSPLPRSRFLAEMDSVIDDDAWLVLAAMDGDTMLGYATAWAVDSSGYLHSYAFATAASNLRLSAALNYEAVVAFKRIGSVKEVSPGIAEPDFPGSTAYKIEQGYPIVRIPARLSLPWPVARYLRARRPHAYYRLSGRGPGD